MKPGHRLLLLGGVVVVLLGLWLRLWHLDIAPPSFYHDELDNVLNGMAWARWGTDVSGTWSVWPPRPLHTLNYMAEWGVLFFGLVYKVVGTSATVARWPSAIFGVLTVLAVMWLVWRWFGNRSLSLWSGLLLWLNPWHIHISRLGYETSVSLCWQVLLVAGGVSWLRTNQEVKSRSWRWVVRDWILIISGLVGAFFSYHAAKFTVIAIVVWLIGWWLVQLPGWRRRLLSVAALGGVLLVLLAYAWGLQRGGAYGPRSQEMIFSGYYLTDLVNSQRRLAVSLPLASLWTNKLTVAVAELSKRYFFVFDPSRLWGTGMESGYQFSLIVSGFFLLTSLPLLVWGVVTIGQSITKSGRGPWFWFWLLLLLSPVATAITVVYQSILRSGLTYLLLLIVAAVGAHGLTKSRSRYLFFWLVCLLVESAYFGTQYFARYPILAADNHYFAEKLLAGYLRYVPGSVTVMVEKDAYNQARSVVYYTGGWSSLTLAERAQFAQSDRPDYHLGNIQVSSRCQPLSTTGNQTYLVEPALWERCHYQSAVATVSARLAALGSPIDSRDYYVVWPEKVCVDQPLAAFVHPNELQDLAVLNQSAQQFCRVWLLGR
jgi:hypothetical protein